MGSNFSDLGQKGVPFFLRTIQHCHLLTLIDEPVGPPSTLAHVHVCHVQEKGSHLPFKHPAAVSHRAARGVRQPGHWRWLAQRHHAGARLYLSALALQVMLVSRHVLTRTWQQCLQTWPQNSYGQLWKRQRVPHLAHQTDLDRQHWEQIARHSYQYRLWETFKADDFAPELFWSIIATMRAFSTIN